MEACWADGYPDLAALESARWVEIVPRSPLTGDARHTFEVPAASRHRYSHVRLRIFPDGGVARLRVHGVVVPDPALLEGLTFDLAALENGGDVVACSDRFYSAPRNAISPGLSRVMGEGWETRRRRAAGNEWLAVRFAGQAVVSLVEVDTSGYIGNSPGMAEVRGYAAGGADDGASVGPGEGGWDDPSSWAPLLPRTALRPDTPHRFRVAAGGLRAGQARRASRRRRGPAAAVRVADRRGPGPGARTLGADGALTPFSRIRRRCRFSRLLKI